MVTYFLEGRNNIQTENGDTNKQDKNVGIYVIPVEKQDEMKNANEKKDTEQDDISEKAQDTYLKGVKSSENVKNCKTKTCTLL